MSLLYDKLKRNNCFVDEEERINKSMALQRELNNKQKIPHCQNSSKLYKTNSRNRWKLIHLRHICSCFGTCSLIKSGGA